MMEVALLWKERYYKKKKPYLGSLHKLNVLYALCQVNDKSEFLREYIYTLVQQAY